MIVEKDTLQHYGILRRSGRYPWGSGGTQNVRNKTYLDVIKELRSQGMTDAQIAEGFSTPEHPLSSKNIRAAYTIALNQQKRAKIDQLQRLKDKGWGYSAIGRRMNMNESSVRALLAPGEKDKVDILTATANMLKRQVDEKGMIDVGHGVHLDLPISDGGNVGISKGKFDTAVAMLQEQGYTVHYPSIRTAAGNDTRMKVLAKPGATSTEVFKNRAQIKLITEHSEDHGRTWKSNFEPPISMSSKRIQVRYKEDGGDKEDGMIYIRPGAKGLDLGKSSYAQVRIPVDGTHYLKGMAAYKDDLPAGVDIVFNTNKSKTSNKLDVMKQMERNEDGSINLTNPFTSSIKRQSGHLNIVSEEGTWDTWSKNLSSQMLSKQSPALAKQQLDMKYEHRKNEFDEIMRLTNPSVRKRLLETFADETDSSAVHLQAAALPRTNNKVILPVNSVKPNQVYAPGYHNGERIVLIRHPHGGTFEIPELTVNNRNPEARKILGPMHPRKDAIAIHHSVAERLSGADFDGDHVLAISNNNRSIKQTPALEGLKGFDPQTYKRDPASGVPPITPKNKQNQMGRISNLITDMTIKGAGPDDLARAIRHSMVVIDSEKHDLDYRRSAIDNGIQQLKNTYQRQPGSRGAGSSTLISRAKSDDYRPDLKLRPASEGGHIDPVTGKKVYVPSGKTRKDPSTGTRVPKLTRYDRLALEDDAHRLSSGTRVEHVYADHSNRLKSLANQARKETLRIKPITKSPSAEKTYEKEVASLKSQLNLSKKNAPLERNAQRLAGQVASQRIRSRPDMDNEEKKKIRTQTLEEMRIRTGANKHQIDISPSEWEAIQAGALAPSVLDQVLTASKLDTVKKLATPRTQKLMTSSKIARAQAMFASGYTQAEVAAHLGVSLTTLKDSLE